MSLSNVQETTRALGVNSVTKVGRHNDYKSDPNCIHIGDLKVPKKYISIIVGETSSTSDAKSPISIKFESICKTTVNGELYRLVSRDDSPFTKEFTDDELLLTVNAQKTSRVRLKIRWASLNVMPFAKKIEYNGEVRESPLPGLLREMHSNGIDIRTCNDPLLATHYLTLSDHADYALKIAVLRSIPVVSTAWTDFIQRTPDVVEKWLFDPGPEFFLPNSPNNYVYPQSSRTHLLSGKSVVLCYLEHLKHLSRLEDWMKCLGCRKIQFFNVNDSMSSFAKLFEASTSEDKYAFSVNGDEFISQKQLKEDLNTSQDLWSSVISSDTLHLKILRKIDKLEAITAKEEESTPRFSQRRKRRKVERVSETDFFQFHSSGMLPATQTDSLNMIEVPEEIVTPSESKVESIKDVDERFDGNNGKNNQQAFEPAAQTHSIEVDNDPDTDKQELHSSNKIETKNDNFSGMVNDERATKRLKTTENSNWIVPQVSLAEAVRATKEETVKSAKQDAVVDKVDGELQKLVLVEEVDLIVLSRKNQVLEEDLRYKGRPNFKAFKKRTTTTSNVTRTYLQLFDDNSLNEMRFIGATNSNKHAPEKILQDFEQEMDKVKGYQPVVSQLFVDEVSDQSDTGDAEYDNTGFSFLGRNKTADNHTNDDDQYDDEEDDRDDFTFAFSRK